MANEVANLPAITAGKVKCLLEGNKDALIKTLPDGFNYDRMCRVVINAISTTYAVAECTPQSIFLSTVRAFATGLEPNGALNEGYLIPFWNKNLRQKECQFMPSYRGLINLARRSGEVTEIYAKAVHENDAFCVNEGVNRDIIHSVDYTKKRGAAVAFYAVFKLKDGGFDFEVMSKPEIDAIRERSKSSQSGPWVTDYDEMAKKTVLKRLLKRAPAKIELGTAIAIDNEVAGDAHIDNKSVIDIDISEFTISDETPAEIQQEMNKQNLENVKGKIAEKKKKNELKYISVEDLTKINETYGASSDKILEIANGVSNDPVADLEHMPIDILDKIYARFDELKG